MVQRDGGRALPCAQQRSAQGREPHGARRLGRVVPRRLEEHRELEGERDQQPHVARAPRRRGRRGERSAELDAAGDAERCERGQPHVVVAAFVRAPERSGEHRRHEQRIERGERPRAQAKPQPARAAHDQERHGQEEIDHEERDEEPRVEAVARGHGERVPGEEARARELERRERSADREPSDGDRAAPRRAALPKPRSTAAGRAAWRTRQHEPRQRRARPAALAALGASKHQHQEHASMRARSRKPRCSRSRTRTSRRRRQPARAARPCQRCGRSPGATSAIRDRRAARGPQRGPNSHTANAIGT